MAAEYRGTNPWMETAGGLESASGNLQAGPLHQTFIDGCAQVDVSVHASESLEIAQRGESDVEVALAVYKRFQFAYCRDSFIIC